MCVLLMLVLQGVAQASAVHIADDATEQHCAGHEADRSNCDCCPDGALASHSGCATLCSVVATLPSSSAYIPRIEANPPADFVAIRRIDPAYLPLTPPPIA